MFSKRTRSFIGSTALLVLIATLGGCDRFLKSAQSPEQKAAEQTVVITDVDLACLQNLPKQVQDYSDDLGTDATVNQVHDCLIHAINTFALYTKGTSSDGYSSDELRHFLNRYLLTDNQISADLMADIMKLKVVLIGGSSTALTRSEIDKIIGVGDRIRDQALALRGNFRLLLFKIDDSKEPAVDKARLDDLHGKVRTALRSLMGDLKLDGTDYDEQDLQDFYVNLNKFLNFDPGGLVASYIPLAQAVKDVFIGPNVFLRNSRDWQTCLDWGVDAFFLGLEYHYRASHWTFTKAQDSQEMSTDVGALLSLIEQSPVFSFKGRIETSDIDDVLDEAWKVDGFAFTKSLPVSMVKSGYRMAILRALDGRHDQVSPEMADALEKRHLSVLDFEYHVWQQSQDFISDLFKGDPAGGVLQTDVEAALKAHKIATGYSTALAKSVASDPDQLKQAWLDWQEVVTRPRPLQWQPDGKILMAADPETARTNIQGMTMMNALRTGVRLLMRGYGQYRPSNFWDVTWQMSDIMSLEHDFDGLFQVSHLVSSLDVKGTTMLLFQEADYFTPAGNGDLALSSEEIMEQLDYMVSSGINLGSDVMDQAVAAKCGNLGSDGNLFAVRLNADCLSRVWRANFARDFAGLPRMVQNVSTLSDSDWSSFFSSMMSVAGTGQKSPAGVMSYDFDDVRTAVVVLYYVENLMLTYDTNHDDQLQQAEVAKASPRFHTFIVAHSPVGNFAADDIFMYLAYHGRKPGLWDMVKFEIELHRGLGNIGRQDLMKALAVLKADAGNTK